MSIPAPLFRYRADDIAGADGTPVSSWPEVGGGPAAIQATSASQPKLRLAALNGHATVEFDGSNDALALSGAVLDAARNKAALLVFIAYKLPATAVTNSRTLLALSTGTSTGARVAVSQNIGTAHVVAGRRLDADGYGSATSSSGSATAEVAVLTGLWRWSAANLFLFKNGAQVASLTTFSTAGSTSDTSSLTGFIGSNANGTAEWFSGQIAEILIYASADTDGSIRKAVDTYLQDTYGPTMADYDSTVSTLAAVVRTTPPSGTVPFTVTASVVANGGVGAFSYAFDWGDGSTTAAQPSASATHSYAAADTTRTITDAVLTAGSTTLTSASAAFTTADVGRLAVGPGIPVGTVITARASATSVTLSQPAAVSGTVTAVVGSYAVTCTVTRS